MKIFAHLRKKWFSDADNLDLQKRFHLYVHGEERFPVGTFTSPRKARKKLEHSFKNNHCRVVDSFTGQSQETLTDKEIVLQEPYLKGIDITSRIMPLPDFLHALHVRNPALKSPNFCWQNCFLTIVSLKKSHPNLRYALTLVHHPDAGVEGHAIIECNGHFFDPTLHYQTQIQPFLTYRLLEVMDLSHMVGLISEKFGDSGFAQMLQGMREWSNFRVDSFGNRAFDL
ncbi:hypothetical protein [Pseudomonas fluorescens]|uniref:Uncharacterized protein n=1 Tax=Pseudomonas fluorescens TaxID=294 RepID=A0A5E6QE45_PSEFL|nr:hypothetical protein [Pseudomonas fluorescens]VVM53567.1 hypothetical protein PS624_00912 [Pseudomonas fluorescens]